MSRIVALVCLLALAVSAQLPGGWTTLESNGDTVQELASFAVEEMDRRSNSAYPHDLLTVQSARSQVVNGVQYELTLQVRQSGCVKGSTNRLGCTNASQNPTKTCVMRVLQSPAPANTRSLTQANCQ